VRAHEPRERAHLWLGPADLVRFAPAAARLETSRLGERYRLVGPASASRGAAPP
jgi:hypothetical protein